MNYQQFASLYDRLMEDAPYDMWMRFFENAIEEYVDHPVKDVLDVACGTGEISSRLAQKGYSVQGIDLSEEMLTVARDKAEQHSLPIPFFQQDMRELEGFQQQDAVVIFCDSLNYLRTIDDVRSTFQRISHILKEEGLLLFDVHSLYKMNEIFRNHTFTYNQEEISYIWECHQGETEGSVEHDLSFFVHIGDSVYERYDEYHYQTTHSIKTYTALLNETGFDVLSITADFSERPPTDSSERLFFIAQLK